MTQKIYHIDEDRWNRIRAQSYHLGGVTLPPLTAEEIAQLKANAEVLYHFIKGDKGFCKECEAEFPSLMGETPSELETEKLEG